MEPDAAVLRLDGELHPAISIPEGYQPGIERSDIPGTFPEKS